MSDILQLTPDPDPTAVAQAGWDFFTAAPGSREQLRCRVCGEVMAVARNVLGPTGWAHAMAMAAGVMGGSRHDEFSGAFGGAAWHRQALALKQEANRTPSRELEKLLLEEAEGVVRARTARKQV